MAQAHGIEIELLEKEDVLEHDLLGLHLPALGVVLVAIHTLEMLIHTLGGYPCTLWTRMLKLDDDIALKYTSGADNNM